MNINLYAIPPVVVSLIVLTTGTYLILQKPRDNVIRAFFGICVGTFIWLFCYGIGYLLSFNPDVDTEWFFRIGFCGVLLLGSFFYHFAIHYLNQPAPRLTILVNLITLVFGLEILFTDQVVQDIKTFYWGNYPLAGPQHPIFFAAFCSMTLSFYYFLLRKYRQTPDVEQHRQIRCVCLGMTVFLLASADFLPNYGIEIYPIGYIPALIFILTVSYGIIRLHVFDINRIIRRSIVYSLSITGITYIYLMVIFIGQQYFQQGFGLNQPLESALIILILGALFLPLKEVSHRVLDRCFFQSSPVELFESNKQLMLEVTEKERLRQLATLSGGIAHEIKNPLTTIKTFCEFLPQKMDNKAFLQQFSVLVQSEVQRIDDLVHELLDYAKPIPLQIRPVNIHQLIEATCGILSNQFVQNHIKILWDCQAPTELTLEVDANRIRQVLMNIILNAVESMTDGGTITLATACEGKDFVLRVTDTGCGIPTADQSQVFTPFYTSKDTGTGLGLAVTQSIVENHGGTIKVERSDATGTTIALRLPVTLQEPSKMEAPA